MPAAMPEVKNQRAAFEYFFLEQYECGLLLTGSEVKSLRNGDASIAAERLSGQFTLDYRHTPLVISGIHNACFDCRFVCILHA